MLESVGFHARSLVTGRARTFNTRMKSTDGADISFSEMEKVILRVGCWLYEGWHILIDEGTETEAKILGNRLHLRGECAAQVAEFFFVVQHRMR